MTHSQSEQFNIIQRADVMRRHVVGCEADVMALGDCLRGVSELHVKQLFGEGRRHRARCKQHGAGCALGAVWCRLDAGN